MLIYEALKKDHDKLKGLLNELVMLGDQDNKQQATQLIEQIKDELVPHSRAEESVFYNSLRAIDSAKDVIMHSFTEHMEAETLLRTISAMDKIDADFKKSAEKLREAVTHHIQEEEGRIFTVARQLFTQDEARMMADAFEKLKPEVREEGFVRQTLDLVANIMPPRFAASLRTFGINPQP